MSTPNNIPVGPSENSLVHSNNLNIRLVSSNISSLASCNLTRDVIASHVHSQEKLTDAQKITANAKCELNKENANALQLKVVQFSDLQMTEITQIAKRFNKMVSYVKQLLTSETQFHNTQAPSLHNALVHAKGNKMNESEHNF
jgi:hypothetical protein